MEQPVPLTGNFLQGNTGYKKVPIVIIIASFLKLQITKLIDKKNKMNPNKKNNFGYQCTNVGNVINHVGKCKCL